MKKIWTLLTFLQLLLLPALAQNAGFPAVDKSPADICYFPSNYPSLKVQDKITGPPVTRVIYSRPRKEGRVIFGQLVEYGKIWRLGANEATEIEFFKPVRINGKKIPKGRYTLYAIVNEKTWTFIVNKETDTWGSFHYNAALDIVRMEVPVQRNTEMLEYLSMNFEKTGTGCSLVVGWDWVKVALPVTF